MMHNKQKIYKVEHENECFIFSTDIPIIKREEYRVYPHLAVMRVIDGEGFWLIGNECCRISRDDIIFMSNLDFRRFVSETGLKLESFSFSSNVFSGVGFSECLRVFYGRTPEFTHIVHSKRLLEIFDACRRESMAENPSFQLLFAYTVELLISANRIYDREHPRMLERELRCNVGDAVSIFTSCVYIQANLSDELRIGALARGCGMSERDYTRKFRKYTSLSPTKYIMHCRVSRFTDLYRTSGGNILDIAFLCGFTSASGFYKCFHRIYGMSPSDFFQNT